MAEEYLTDDEQLEAVKRACSEYAPWMFGGVLLGVGGWFGIRYYQLASKCAGGAGGGAIQRNDQCAAGERSARNPGKSPMGSSRTIPASPYADQAQLTIARIDVDENKRRRSRRSADASHEQLQGCGAAADRAPAPGAHSDRSRQAGRGDQDAGEGMPGELRGASTTRCAAMRCMRRRT